MKKTLVWTVSVLLVWLLTSSAFAGWEAINLNPMGSVSSVANGVSVGSQSGYAWIGGAQHAISWNGDSSSKVDLNPSGATASVALGGYGNQQVGWSQIGDTRRASLWSGTASTRVDLNPATASSSTSYAISGSQQVGSATINGSIHATIWNGSAGNWTDLNPTPARPNAVESRESVAFDTSGAQQVGYAIVDQPIGYAQHASLWRGSASSWVDLNPIGSAWSYAYGISAPQQVGVANINGVSHAGIWSGSADSWTDLNPQWSTSSCAYDTSGSQQVGFVTMPGTTVHNGGVWSGLVHAGIWTGSAASWIDLHSVLSTDIYHSSTAKSIYTSGEDIWIAGHANRWDGYSNAMLWHYTADPVIPPQPVPEASTLLAACIMIIPVGLSRLRQWQE